MIFAGYSQTLLGDGLGASVGTGIGVRELQNQLRRLAVDRNKYEIDPGQYDGNMSLGTIMALANAASATAGAIGAKTHPVVGQIIDVMGRLRGGLSKIPYAGQILSVVFSPWLIDEVYGALLGIMRLVPGGGKTATALDNSIKSIKTTLTTAAAPIAAALALIPKVKPTNGLAGPVTDPFGYASMYRSPIFYEPAIHGPLVGGGQLGFWNPVSAVVDVAQGAAGAVADFAGDAASAIKNGAATAWDYTSKAAQAVWNAAAKNVSDIAAGIRKYGCMLVSNEIVVAVAATGTGIVASPAASAAVVAGASTGKAACAVIAVGELVVAILKLLARKFRKPPSLTSTPPATTTAVAVTNMKFLAVPLVPGKMTKADLAQRVTHTEEKVAEGQLLLPLPSFQTPPEVTKQFAGCFYRFNVTRKVYAIYCPRSKAAGLGLASLGAEPDLVKIVEVNTKAETGAATSQGVEEDAFYRRPLFWVAVAGGLTVVVGGTIFAVRRSRKSVLATAPGRRRRLTA